MLINENEKDRYIREIDMLHDKLKIVRDNNAEWGAITEYDSVYQDILDYEDNDYEDFKTNEDFIEFIDYLKDLIKEGEKNVN